MQKELLKDISSLLKGYHILRQNATILQIMKIYSKAITYTNEIKGYADDKNDEELKNYLDSISCDEMNTNNLINIVKLCDFISIVDYTCQKLSKYIEKEGIKDIQ